MNEKIVAGEIYGTVDNNMDGQVLRIVKCMESVLNGNTKKYKKVWLQSLNRVNPLIFSDKGIYFSPKNSMMIL